MTAHQNGGWPELPRQPVALPELGEHASPTERAVAYATVLATWYDLWGRLVAALEHLRDRDAALDRALASLRVDLTNEIRAAAGGRRSPPIPPMRATWGSSHDLAKVVGHDVAAEFEREAGNPSTPPPDGRTVAAMVEDRVARELQRIKLESLERADADRREARRARGHVLVAVIVTTLTILGAIVEHFAR